MKAVYVDYQQTKPLEISDTGERILPTADGEVSFVFSRHKFAYEYVQQFVAGKGVIDVGCGTGYGCKTLAETAQLVCGVDYSAEAIAYCQRHFAGPNITYLQMDAKALAFERQFDAAVTLQVIEHIPNPGDFIEQLKRVVHPGGTIFISTPNVRKPQKETDANPFHFSEMNYTRFHQLISDKFSAFEILAVSYATPNRIRSVVAKLPFYKWGRKLARKSLLKKVANRALDLTTFKIIDSNLEKEAADFLAICQNS